MDNSNTKVVEFPSIGAVHFVKKKGIRRVSIVVKPFKGVVVSVPYSVAYADAERFVIQKSDWIDTAKAKMAKLEARKTVFDESTIFKTKKRTLLFIRNGTDVSVVKASVTSSEIRIQVPNNVACEHPTVQGVTANAIEKAWVMEAKEILPERTQYLANKFGLKFRAVSVKRIKSRWGSCSVTNNINLSVYLMNLPDHLIDYVILHELCHTVEKNHGVNFWKLLNKLTDGKAKELARQMKSYSTRYF